jgi:hypothetical protein
MTWVSGAILSGLIFAWSRWGSWRDLIVIAGLVGFPLIGGVLFAVFRLVHARDLREPFRVRARWMETVEGIILMLTLVSTALTVAWLAIPSEWSLLWRCSAIVALTVVFFYEAMFVFSGYAVQWDLEWQRSRPELGGNEISHRPAAASTD